MGREGGSRPSETTSTSFVAEYSRYYSILFDKPGGKVMTRSFLEGEMTRN